MKTVIFFGAGASRAEGAPLQKDLFSDYFKMREVKSREQEVSGLFEDNTDYMMERSIKSYFKDLFGIDENLTAPNMEFPTFEEVLGMIDLATIRGERFYRMSDTCNYNLIGNNNYDRISLVMLMAETIKYNLDKRNASKYHEVLIKKLLLSGKLDEVSLITTNYDIIIDNALRNERNIAIDYGMNFYTQNNGQQNNRVKLYKIHGSLNWLYCSVCNKIEITNGEKSVTNLIDNMRKATCPRCKSLCEPIIVPPTYYKNINNFYLNLIWEKAERELTEAEHVVFCGYSFPDADIHIKYMLKRAEVNRKLGNNLKITIINNHENKTNFMKDEESLRYKRFFKTETIINYSELSFEQFAENPNNII